jgi:hypothetical protein
LARISDSEFGHDIYKGISFYTIQDSITYDYNFRTFGNNFYTIHDFRPEIKNNDIHLLYLNSVYTAAINSFLGSEYTPVGTGGIMTPALPAGEIAERYNFLSNYLYFFHGHWGNYWHLETHPQVSGISFNETKDSAQVYFRLGYQGGEAILGKDGDAWKVADHYMTWIE